jgi:hypothetical protein
LSDTRPSDTGDPELDELLRAVDRLCAERDWTGLLDLHNSARSSHERGRQHWPAAEYAAYRLALEAPGPFAASVIVEGAGRFALGPLTEVAASTHSWDELGPHIPSGPLAAITAHERVIRGEDLTQAADIDPSVLQVPLVLEEWETSYAVASYRSDKADFPMPELPALHPVELPPTPHEHTTDVDEARALRGLAATWTTESNGVTEAVAVAGAGLQAVAALGVSSARATELTPGQAFAVMAWTAASGGANGRRRGMAWGRYLAWECASILLDVEIEDVAHHVDELGWYSWDSFDAQTGWSLRLAVDDPANGSAWALSAVDHA